MSTTNRRKRRSAELQRNRSIFGIACALPTAILFTVFIVVPTINIFRMSLYKWSGFSGVPEFVGLNNFKILLGDMNFVHSLQNTLLLLIVVTCITMPVAVIFAAMLIQTKILGANLLRFVMYIPSILSAVVIAAMFSVIYDQADTGLVNGTLHILRLDWLKQVWLGDHKIVIFSIAFAMVWQSFGYYMVMYMASMTGIDKSLYEAASLDGAGQIRTLVSVTVPLIWSNIRTTLIFFILGSVNLSFVLVKAMTDGGPDNASQVILGYMYDQAYTNSSYGYGMAIGVVIFLFSLILSLIVSRATKREPIEL